MWRHADRQIDEFIEGGQCEFIREYAGPFTLYVIADLLGVPESDHETFRQELQGRQRGDQGLGSTGAASMAHSPLEFSMTGSLPMSRIVDASPATMSSPAWPRPLSLTARLPRSSTSSASPPTCSPPVRRRPSAFSERRSSDRGAS